MTLTIHVAVLAHLLATDPDAAADFEDELAAANRVLAAERLPRHAEPRTVRQAPRSPVASIPHAALHHLRRAYAHRVNDPAWIAAPFPADADPADDAAVEALTEQFESHLLCHSDHEGFYFPIELREVVVSNEDDDVPGGLLGSSQRLLEELHRVAPALGVELDKGTLPDAEAARIAALGPADPLWAELTAWAALFEAAQLSIAYKAAIVFD